MASAAPAAVICSPLRCISSTPVEADSASPRVPATEPIVPMVAGAGDDLAAGLQRRVCLDDHDALAGGAAVLHAAHDFLPHEAALAERHAVEQIHVGLVREGVAEGVVLAAFGHAERDAVRVIVGGGGVGLAGGFLRQSRCDAWPPQRAHSEFGQPRVEHLRHLLGVLRRRSVVPVHLDDEFVACVLDVDACAEPVHLQPLHELCGLFSGRLDQEAAAMPRDEKIEQHLPLRRQQRGKHGAARRSPQLDVIGHQALQQFLRIAAVDAHDAAVGKQRCLGMRHVGCADPGCRGRPFCYISLPTGRRHGGDKQAPDRALLTRCHDGRDFRSDRQGRNGRQS